jgi:hypothetical protein
VSDYNEDQYTLTTGVDIDGSPMTLIEAKYAPTSRRATGSKWFVCPVTLQTLRQDEGVKVRGVWYSYEGAREVRGR